MFHNKVVVRAGAGMYYDRGELFSYFSPGYAIGTVTGGPFGVNQQLPFVNASSCPTRRNRSMIRLLSSNLRRKRRLRSAHRLPTDETGNLENPYGTTLQHPAPQSQGFGLDQLSAQCLQHRELW